MFSFVKSWQILTLFGSIAFCCVRTKHEVSCNSQKHSRTALTATIKTGCQMQFSFCTYWRWTSIFTFASISSAFSLASCSMKAIICLICNKREKIKYFLLERTLMRRGVHSSFDRPLYKHLLIHIMLFFKEMKLSIQVKGSIHLTTDYKKTKIILHNAASLTVIRMYIRYATMQKKIPKKTKPQK